MSGPDYTQPQVFLHWYVLFVELNSIPLCFRTPNFLKLEVGSFEIENLDVLKL